MYKENRVTTFIRMRRLDHWRSLGELYGVSPGAGVIPLFDTPSYCVILQMCVMLCRSESLIQCCNIACLHSETSHFPRSIIYIFYASLLASSRARATTGCKSKPQTVLHTIILGEKARSQSVCQLVIASPLVSTTRFQRMRPFHGCLGSSPCTHSGSNGPNNTLGSRGNRDQGSHRRNHYYLQRVLFVIQKHGVIESIVPTLQPPDFR